MLVMADTNILMRVVNITDVQHEVASAAIERLREQRTEICIAPQNIVEFWNSATRPLNRNGLGMLPSQIRNIVARLEDEYMILPENPDVYPLWKKLVSKYSVSGTKVHDTRLVASAIVHNVTKILTFNTADFQRYSEIEVLDPKSI